MAITHTAETTRVRPLEPAGDTPLPRARRRWGVALQALRQLLSNKEDTGQVFRIMAALNADVPARNYRRLLGTVRGGRLAYERVELAQRMMDDAWLDSFAAGTVGAAYREFVRGEKLSAEGLADVSRQARGNVDSPHPHEWVARRTRDIHDVWHVLTGYHRDGLGEACLVAFSYPQTRGLGWAVIAAGAALRARRQGGRRHVAAIWQGYRNGRRAAWLIGEDYEALLREPLESARARLGIVTPTAYDAIAPAARG